MAEWQTSNRKGLYVRHATRCRVRQGRRCSCEPSYRGKRRSPATGQPEYSPTSKQRSEILTWLEGGDKATEAVRERRAAGPTFGELADRWRAGVENGSIAKRRGRGRYSPTTWRRYGQSLDYTLLPARSERFPLGEGFGDRVAAHIEAARVAGVHRPLCPPRAQALRPSTTTWRRSTRSTAGPPTRPGAWSPATRRAKSSCRPATRSKRLRIADPVEAAHLLAALVPDDALPYAIAFYGGPRRSELERLEWADVDLDAQLIHVRASKSEAGTNRRAPFAAPLLPLLRAAFCARAGPPAGACSARRG